MHKGKSSSPNYKVGSGSSTIGAKKGANYFCTHCKISGHSVDKCFKIHGYPPNFNGLRAEK